MDRREFLRHLLLASGGLMFSVGTRGWAARLADSASRDGRRLVVVFLRGAVDGLNVVVPWADDRYYEARPTIAIPKPGQASGVTDLDGHFGLHPALASILPLWQNKTLAFIHASGSPDPSRSHFEAQAFMETGTPGVATTPDGWMNRLLGALPGPRSPSEALSLGPTLPRILVGSNSVANLPLGRNADHPIPLDRPKVADAFGALYQGDTPVDKAFQQGQRARGELMSDLAKDMSDSFNGAPAVDGFTQDSTRLAELMNRDSGIRLAFLAVGGWDTHVGEGSSKGQLSRNLESLGNGLAALAKGLGPAYQDTAIVVMSEFGRTFRENGNAGTDHGHGNAMWLMGGSVKGGEVYGDWPGLADDQLYQNRDLAVTTDFRQVLASVLGRHLGLGDAILDQVFPGGPGGGTSLGGLIS
ncbi:MAG TPA: DUF1501 domain-containing protein [Gammaproteobacteria bacterium]|nr:DUF1501 domain-containing protein [Gammaproteobacteria bacterium]